jgi:hypothetical protein
MVDVFLSSTARDLADYREAVTAAIRKMDGFHCVRMEDFGARDRESVEFCKQRVAASDVYVGIYGHLYGSRPKRSEKSFTEIEYEAAVLAERPRLLFQAPSEFNVRADQIESSKDRKAQAKFRERVRSERNVEFFDSPESLAVAVAVALHNWRVETHALVAVAGSADQTPAEPEKDPAKQRAASLGRLAGFFKDTKDMTYADAVRAFLAAHAVISNETTDLLSVHEINLAYRFRERLSLDAHEWPLLWKTALSDHHGSTPGWYWLKEIGDAELEDGLWYLAREEPETRRGVLNLALRRAISLPADESQREAVLRELLSDDGFRIAADVLSLLLRIGDFSFLDLAIEKRVGERHDARDDFFAYEWAARLRSAPEESFSALLDLQELDEERVSRVAAEVANVPLDSIRKGLAASRPTARAMSVSELRRRKCLTVDEARLLLNDPNKLVAQAAVEALSEAGERIDTRWIRETFKAATDGRPGILGLKSTDIDVDRLVYTALTAQGEESLRSVVDWMSLDGHLAYRVLAERFLGSFGDELRRDIGERFASMCAAYHLTSKDKLVETLATSGKGTSPEVLEQVVEDFIETTRAQHPDLDDFVEGQFLEAAFCGLRLHASPDDLPLVKDLLLNPKPKYYGKYDLNALEIVSKVGGSGDVPWLESILGRLSGVTLRRAVEVLLELSSYEPPLVERYLQRKEVEHYEPALRAIDRIPNADALLEACLFNENEAKRRSVANLLCERWDERQLTDCLSRYLTKRPYYYNVVHILDRRLNAPEKVWRALLS